MVVLLVEARVEQRNMKQAVAEIEGDLGIHEHGMSKQELMGGIKPCYLGEDKHQGELQETLPWRWKST